MTVGELAEQLKHLKPTLDVLALHMGDDGERYLDVELPRVKAGNHGKDLVLIPVTERKP